MSTKESALRRRIPPSVPLTLELADHLGGKITKGFTLCFDFNAIALVEEITGLGLLTGEIWEVMGRDEEEAGKKPRKTRARGSAAKALSVMFWAASLAHHPEYDSDEGLAVIRSYMDPGNAVKITSALHDAFLASLPEEQREKIKQKAGEGDEAPLAGPAPEHEKRRAAG